MWYPRTPERALTRMPTTTTYPVYGNCPAKPHLDDLFRLVSPDFFTTSYIDARSAAALVVAGLRTYRNCRDDPRWNTNPILTRLCDGHGRLNMVAAGLFDLICNAEYLHGRLTNRSWIYCNRNRESASPSIYAYYSFLKQCPVCCQDRGLEPRIHGAQHKPTSHHIGEITTVATALFLRLLAKSAHDPLEVGIISKQSHNVDAVAWRSDLLVLFEIKASPLITYPARVRLGTAFTEQGDERPSEIRQHNLIDVDFRHHDISLFLANTARDIPLGPPDGAQWPYPSLVRFLSTTDGLLSYIESWGEVFLAYRIPKTQRVGKSVATAYLANGWGDEIDSNKTKGGLGRTDDIKKGTYQLLKFAAYYRQGSPSLPIRSALTSNLDPLFLYDEYLEKLVDGRWAPADRFRASAGAPDFMEIPDDDLFYIYDAILAFNRPMINDSYLRACFDFSLFEEALVAGRLDSILDEWSGS